uniref:Uncharacterized protein n=1 Tax=Sphaerodactylus townsendi TaxID=933632 RepID=A0ACB8FML9_9SAUR
MGSFYLGKEIFTKEQELKKKRNVSFPPPLGVPGLCVFFWGGGEEGRYKRYFFLIVVNRAAAAEKELDRRFSDVYLMEEMRLLNGVRLSVGGLYWEEGARVRGTEEISRTVLSLVT